MKPTLHIHITFSSDPSQLDTFLPDEAQGLVDVVDFVHPHLPPLLGWRHLLARYNLQQAEECQAIPQVLIQLIDLDAHLAQMRVAPSGESLHNTHTHTQAIIIDYIHPLRERAQ